MSDYDYRYVTDWKLVSVLKTTAHELARIKGSHPDAAPIMFEAAKRLGALLMLVETHRSIQARTGRGDGSPHDPTNPDPVLPHSGDTTHE